MGGRHCLHGGNYQGSIPARTEELDTTRSMFRLRFLNQSTHGGCPDFAARHAILEKANELSPTLVRFGVESN